MEFPKLHLVDQGFEQSCDLNVQHAVLDEVRRSGWLNRVSPGQRVLITAGSRGVACMTEALRAVVSSIKSRGANPLILPAMGSHGGGSARGQVEVLHHLGQTEESLGAPLHDRLDPIAVGEVEGCPVYADRAAVETDHILLVNRVKEHTEFIGPFESGLIKMAVVGLGRIAGAEAMHQLAVRVSYVRAIQAMARVLFARLPVRGGLAILEDKTNQVRRIEAVPAEAVFEREPELLREAQQHHAALPFEQMDVLLVDEIGKEISGAGFDTKVIGRIMNIYERECERPRITRIALRDLSERTGGNAIGLGLADFVHRRVVAKMDAEMTALNCITAVAPEKGRIPISLPSDRRLLGAALRSIGMWSPPSVRLAWIVNTSSLEQLAVSPALAEEARAKGLAVDAAGFPFPFDADGELPGLRRLLAGRQPPQPVESPQGPGAHR
ncbi:MAG: DUF362 domain-containing protein [Desulfobacterales bacterium]|jgi:hypothetical protein|nr:DUF362 domain-containing protein [Desulfobacterales bacterium]